MRRVAIPSTAQGNGGGAESASPRLARCKGWASLPKQNHTWHVSTSAREAETSSSGAPAHCATVKHCIAAATSVRGRGGIPSAHPPVHATHTPFHSHSGGVTGTLKGPRLPRLPWGTWPGTHTRRSQPESLLLLSRSRRPTPHRTEAAATRSLMMPRGAHKETWLFRRGEKHWRTETGAGSCSGRASGRPCGG